MKRALLVFLTLVSFSLFADEKIDLTPMIEYKPSQRYNKDFPSQNSKIIEKKEKKSKYDISIDMDIDHEEKTIDSIKLDMQTDFKGIN